MAVDGYVRRFPFPLRDSKRQIMMRDREWDIFQNDIPARSKARLELLADDYCTSGPDLFDKTDFRFLGHKSYEGVKVRLEEFKAPQVRLFGFSGDMGGMATFFVTGIDPAKKQRKANDDKVTSAVKEAVRLKQLLSKSSSKGKR